MSTETPPNDSSPGTSESSPALLQVEDLCIEYVTAHGPVPAVDHLSLTLHQGEVLGLAGESGSGKSTMAMGALRLLPPPALITGGRVLFEGRDILSMSEHELSDFRWREISVVFQSAMNALSPVLSIGEQLTDVMIRHERIGKREALERASELLRLVGIDGAHLRSYPHQLSGGMRQRVVIAIALALRPKVLFMDEPTTALDVVVQREILQEIRELRKKLNFSILLITHDLGLMLEFCDTIGILYAGRLAELAPAQQLLAAPRHPYTRGLMSSSPSVHGPRRRTSGLSGSPPDMLHPPQGCRFHPRCSEAIERCRLDVPPLLQLEERHHAACHLSLPKPRAASTSRQAPDRNDATPPAAKRAPASPSDDASEPQ